MCRSPQRDEVSCSPRWRGLSKCGAPERSCGDEVGGAGQPDSRLVPARRARTLVPDGRDVLLIGPAPRRHRRRSRSPRRLCPPVDTHTVRVTAPRISPPGWSMSASGQPVGHRRSLRSVVVRKLDAVPGPRQPSPRVRVSWANGTPSRSPRPPPGRLEAPPPARRGRDHSRASGSGSRGARLEAPEPICQGTPRSHRCR